MYNKTNTHKSICKTCRWLPENNTCICATLMRYHAMDESKISMTLNEAWLYFKKIQTETHTTLTLHFSLRSAYSASQLSSVKPLAAILGWILPSMSRVSLCHRHQTHFLHQTMTVFGSQLEMSQLIWKNYNTILKIRFSHVKSNYTSLQERYYQNKSWCRWIPCFSNASHHPTSL